MVKKNDDFLKKLLTTFRVEADEHIEAMSSGLLDLEKTPPGEQQAEIVEKVFREAHSLKGAARAVNLVEIESVCQSLESVFAALKSNRVSVSPPLFDLLHHVTDTLKTILSSGVSEKPIVAALIRQLDDASNGMVGVERSAPARPVASADAATLLPVASLGSGTIRVHLTKLDSVMRQTEELFAPRLAAGQRVIELRETSAAIAAWKKERANVQPARRSMERSLARTDKTNDAAKGQPELTKLIEYLEAENVFLKTVEGRVAKLERS